MADPNESNATVLPSRAPQPTGNLAHDVWQVSYGLTLLQNMNNNIFLLKSVKNISDIPCARGALMSGIASGAGIGVMRGLSAGVLLAGHWAIATFAVVSIGSWYVLCMLRLSLFETRFARHICQARLANERKTVTKIMESAPRRIKQEQPTSQQ